MVTGKNQDIFRMVGFHKFHILIDRVRRAGVPLAVRTLLIRRQDRYAAVSAVQIPRNTDSDMGIQPQGTILCQDTDRINAGVYTVAERKINNPVLAAECNCRFGYFCCQNAQTASLAAGQQHGYHFFLLNHKTTSLFPEKKAGILLFSENGSFSLSIFYRHYIILPSVLKVKLSNFIANYDLTQAKFLEFC